MRLCIKDPLTQYLESRGTRSATLKKVYVCHPFRGGRPYTEEKAAKNMAAVSRICRLIAERDRCVPFSPIHAFSFYHALDAEATERVMRMCMELLETCDEMWVFGDWRNSEGCLKEIEHASKARIPIKFKE